MLVPCLSSPTGFFILFLLLLCPHRPCSLFLPRLSLFPTTSWSR
ncbi:hypothetical protein D4764_05G0006090 [Takifugu flavidus]|uniref:Uncharacterized protein n=1 Tax=Takifugu flavidus TaxID=433684 RepID=A0A5C6N0L5_9TELE|nr:hypothetical protein D4764_05G0006090 [Takifugu flavidus]